MKKKIGKNNNFYHQCLFRHFKGKRFILKGNGFLSSL